MSGDYEPPDDDEVICHCGAVTREMLVTGIQDGLTTMRQLRDTLGASIACMSCAAEVEEILDEQLVLLKKQNKLKKATHPAQQDLFLLPDD
mgnify:CR=1 FL=1